MPDSTPPIPDASPQKRCLPRRLIFIRRAIMVLGLALSIYEHNWLNVAVIGGILLLTSLPLVFFRRHEIYIPPVFEMLAIAFIFASLFLGEVRGYYIRFWWWDVMLHGGSAIGFGLIGFVLVFMMFQGDRFAAPSGAIAFFAFWQ